MNRNILLFGAGQIGERVLNTLKGIDGLNIVGFVDNDKTKVKTHGLPVFTPEVAILKDDCEICICIYKPDSVVEQLKALGYTKFFTDVDNFLLTLNQSQINALHFMFTAQKTGELLNDFDVVSIMTGIAWSGSSSVNDFLREFDTCLVMSVVNKSNCGYMRDKVIGQEFSIEVDFLRHAGGVFELEHFITSNNIFLKDAAIKRFITLFEFNHRIMPTTYTKYYLQRSRRFVDDLTNYKVVGETPVYNPHLVYEGGGGVEFKDPFALRRGKKKCVKY